MKILRRVVLGSVVSLFAVILTSDASTAGKAALLAVSLVLGWLEWRTWKKA